MRSLSAILFTLACSLAACGGDSGGPVESGLPADKTGEDLTTDEAETLCTANAEHAASQNTAAELKNFACVFAGLGFSAASDNTPAKCEEFAQMCRDGAGEDGGGDGGGEESCALGFELESCSASIADIEACLTEKNEAAGDAIRQLSCDDAGKPTETPMAGPLCAKIKAVCPTIVAGA